MISQIIINKVIDKIKAGMDLKTVFIHITGIKNLRTRQKAECAVERER